MCPEMIRKRILTPGKDRPADAPKMGRPTADEARQRKVATILERVSNGDDLGSVCSELGLAPATFRGWCRADKALDQEWQLARREYAHSLFDKIAELSALLSRGKDATTDEPLSAAQVNGLKAAIDGYKHVAARLNPAQYGEQKAGQQGVVVMINSTLPLGDGAGPVNAIDADFTAVVKLEGPDGK